MIICTHRQTTLALACYPNAYSPVGINVSESGSPAVYVCSQQALYHC